MVSCCTAEIFGKSQYQDARNFVRAWEKLTAIIDGHGHVNSVRHVIDFARGVDHFVVLACCVE